MNMRLIASRIIHQVTEGRSLTDCLEESLSSIKDHRDRAFVQALCYGVCRFYSRLDAVLSYLLTKPMKAKDSDVHALLLVGLYQLMEMRVPHHAAVAETVSATEKLKKPWSRGLVNAVLREYLRQENTVAEQIKEDAEALYAHPQWWITAIKKAWPENWEQILNANNEHPPFAMRVNQQKLSRDAYLQLLKENDITANIIPETQHGIIVDNPTTVDKLPGFTQGMVSIQDGAAQLAAELMQIKPGQNILDACAAPGGKLTHILEIDSNASVLAVESDAKRIPAIKENLTRLQCTAKIICADAADTKKWWDGKLFDKILLDVPCSASGVVRRHPDIKLLREYTDLRTLATQQQHLLDALWPLLNANGLLLYSTCSIFPAENMEVIANFLKQHADAKEETITASWGIACQHGRQILPGMHHMDGFYYACLSKNKS